ncbi:MULTISPECIES: hypothetical protein [unclassified Duganella]|uniref:hypothetical protein n=1 Tax=unclassified Duganella TaxID=2636909 RepID=UPI00088AF1A5|nr:MULTISPECIES: hypothetical protein [unclassified Duganella]SDG85124.1 hypothetical protein SAMN05216320_107290 [Duganella sp. OV458]SDK12524.1 hypothetical protein SAMN05428973_108291 [Duganella sp. OV510]
MKLINLTTKATCSLAEFITAHAPTIFPTDAALIDFSEWDHAVLVDDPQPAINDLRENVVLGEIIERDGCWCQTYQVAALPAEAVAANLVAEQDRIAEVKRQLVSQIDDAIAAIYARWQRFESEYVLREAAARAYVDGGYHGDPGVWVTAYATGAGIALDVAADRILQQADTRRDALEQLAALRMSKYSIEAAVDVAAAAAAHDLIAQRAAEIGAAA